MSWLQPTTITTPPIRSAGYSYQTLVFDRPSQSPLGCDTDVSGRPFSKRRRPGLPIGRLPGLASVPDSRLYVGVDLEGSVPVVDECLVVVQFFVGPDEAEPGADQSPLRSDVVQGRVGDDFG